MGQQKSKYGYLAKNTLLFTISSFGSKLLVFLLVPLYTSFLSTVDYGVADLITTTSTLFIYVFTINIADAVLRFVIDKKTNRESYLAYGIRILLIGSFLFALVVFTFWKLNIFSWQEYCYVYLFLNFFTVALYQILSNYLRAIDKVKDVAISGIINTIVTIGLNIFTLVFLKIGLTGYLVSMVLGSFVASMYCLVQIRFSPRILTNTCDKQNKRAMRNYSIPLIFNGMAWWVNNSIDKYFVTWILGASQNGIYAVSYKIPTILTVFHSIFSQAWNLSAIKEFDENDKDGFFAKTYTMYNAILVLLCSVLIIFNIPIAKILFAKDFFVAWKYSSVLLISIVFSSMSGFIGSIFTAVKDSRIFAISTVVSAVMNCTLNGLLIPRLGVMGAAIATAISFCIIWAIRLLCSRKYIKWHLNLKIDIIAYILLCIQTAVEHLENHCYIVQFLILFVLIFLYRKEILTCIKKLLKSNL